MATKKRKRYNSRKKKKQNNKKIWFVIFVLVNILIFASYRFNIPNYDLEWNLEYEAVIDDTKDYLNDILADAFGESSYSITTSNDSESTTNGSIGEATSTYFDYNLIEKYTGNPYVEVNNNIPYFTEDEITDVYYEYYGELDSLGRCTIAEACLGIETMPVDGEERGSISSVTPTGWNSTQYDCVEAGYSMNRSHCIAWSLSAENDNENNLISGTRYMNIEMYEYEELVADYINTTGNHVMYRVTPIFVDDELLCRGVLMEGYSVEDEGEGIYYNVFFYNVQPGLEFDYANGDSWYTGIFLDMDASTVNYDVLNN
ncbi:MAG: DNA/RNA non-specific endonuclease [Eubacteriales bacterium]